MALTSIFNWFTSCDLLLTFNFLNENPGSTDVIQTKKDAFLVVSPFDTVAPEIETSFGSNSWI